MNKLIIASLALAISLIACSKDQKEDNDSRDSVSLLMSTQYNSDPNYAFEYNEDHQLTKVVTNGGIETKEYLYDQNGDFSGFIETSQSNAIYPTRKFEVAVNTPSEISGPFYLMDPSGVVDSSQTSHHLYELDNGLIKTYLETNANGSIWKKSFEHNGAGDLTAIQLFENPNPGHLYRMEFSQWDDKEATNIFASFLQTYPAMDIIPGIKISNHNMIDKTDLYESINCCSSSTYSYEYNDFDQITRIFVTSADQLDENGNVIVMGGEEIDIAVFTYQVVD